MDTATFWHMIESAKAESNGDCDQQAQLLEQRLTQLPPEEIQNFNRVLWQFMDQSYNDDLWVAASIVNAGCTEDGFEYFRGWLIAQGEAIFYAALQDPDSLAEIVDSDRDDYDCEPLLYVAMGAYEARTGTEMPQLEPSPEESAKQSLELNPEKEQIWTDSDFLEEYSLKRFPKLCAKYD